MPPILFQQHSKTWDSVVVNDRNDDNQSNLPECPIAVNEHRQSAGDIQWHVVTEQEERDKEDSQTDGNPKETWPGLIAKKTATINYSTEIG